MLHRTDEDWCDWPSMAIAPERHWPGSPTFGPGRPDVASFVGSIERLGPARRFLLFIRVESVGWSRFIRTTSFCDSRSPPVMPHSSSSTRVARIRRMSSKSEWQKAKQTDQWTAGQAWIGSTDPASLDEYERLQYEDKKRTLQSQHLKQDQLENQAHAQNSALIILQYPSLHDSTSSCVEVLTEFLQWPSEETPIESSHEDQIEYNAF